MALQVITDDPKRLLEELLRALGAGEVPGWKLGRKGLIRKKGGKHAKLASLSPHVVDERVVINIVVAADDAGPDPRKLYAAYHGRFVQMLLGSFRDRFHSVIVSAMPSAGSDEMPLSHEYRQRG